MDLVARTLVALVAAGFGCILWRLRADLPGCGTMMVAVVCVAGGGLVAGALVAAVTAAGQGTNAVDFEKLVRNFSESKSSTKGAQPC